MMRVRSWTSAAALVAGLAFVPSTAAGQRPYAWVAPTAEEVVIGTMAPFSVLLENRDSLRLESAQVRRIESVQERLVERNESLLAQLRDAEQFGVETDEERAAIALVREEFEGNAAEAEDQVAEILTPDQRDRADELLGTSAWAYPNLDEILSPVEDVEEPEGWQEEVATVTVDNQNFHDANIYVISGGRRQRLGFVAGLNTQTFDIPSVFTAGSGGVSFEVRQIPSYTLPRTDYLTVFPGDEVFVRIPPS